MFRSLLIALCLLPALLLTGSASAQALDPSAQVEPAPQTVSGRGQRVSDRFSLQSGLAIFRMRHSGSRNFIIHLLNAAGNQVGFSLVNEIGAFDGATAISAGSAGDYIMDVQADGDWSVTIEQPRPTSAPETPATFTGHGIQVTPFFALPPGLKVVAMQHNGKRNFIVHLLDRTGSQVGFSLVNEIGPFNGSKAVNAVGIHLLTVVADGDWSITIQ